MTQSLVLSIEVCRGLGISPLRVRHFAELFSGRYWPNIRPGTVFSVVFPTYGYIFLMEICAHSQRCGKYTNITAGIFDIQSFCWQHRVSISTGLKACISFLKYQCFGGEKWIPSEGVPENVWCYPYGATIWYCSTSSVPEEQEETKRENFSNLCIAVEKIFYTNSK